jgi:hypothetical protein
VAQHVLSQLDLFQDAKYESDCLLAVQVFVLGLLSFGGCNSAAGQGEGGAADFPHPRGLTADTGLYQDR